MQRIRSLDLARGFTVLMIAPIHCVLVYSDPSVHETILGKFLVIIAEGPGAPLFMLLMGVYFSFPQQQHIRECLSRAGDLLLTAFLLNVLKFIVPWTLGFLPTALLSDLMISHPVQLIFIGDILHFASIALIPLFFVRILKSYHYFAIALAIIVCFISPLLWDLHSDNLVIDYLLQLTGGQPPHIFFPLFPWLAYPLAGLATGYYIQKNSFIATGVTGCFLILCGFCIYEPSDFYRTGPGATIVHIGVVLLTLLGWHKISRVRENYFSNCWLSQVKISPPSTARNGSLFSCYCHSWVTGNSDLTVHSTLSLSQLSLPTLSHWLFMKSSKIKSLSMEEGSRKKPYDLIGIGIGPFNLGLAALTHSITNFESLFIEQQSSFHWHPGLLVDNARLQVPFYADLVTLADPCSYFSYMAYLKAKHRMFRFAIHENYFVTRKEYNDYCRWVTRQLHSLKFNYPCRSIHYDEASELYIINKELRAKNIVIGIGTQPSLPGFATGHPSVIHSSAYIFHKETILEKDAVTVIGSGQSAAEVFNDLLNHHEKFPGGIHWFTRSERFFPMEYSKLTLEMTSHDYIEHFYSLDPGIKEKILAGQSTLYKGINFSLINEIYDRLYLLSVDNKHRNIRIHTNCELQSIHDGIENKPALQFLHTDTNQPFTHETSAVILATGYKHSVPAFIEPIRHKINWDHKNRYATNRDYSIDNNKSIFIQNAEEHTHGFNSADLGMGPYRNATIINTILGIEYYPMEKNTSFQTFGLP